MRIPVLTYHAMNIAGNDAMTNDHAALREDLLAIHGAGYACVSAKEAVSAALGLTPPPKDRSVCLTFDDGSWFDWHDLDHPTWGRQESFAGILRAFSASTGTMVHATSFVIVSPHARAVLDRTCMAGAGWWGHEWWAQAESEGMIAIEPHTWDHNHETLPAQLRLDPVGGRFDHVSTHAEARRQIGDAVEWLNAHVTQRATRLLAWPYGQSSDYLRVEWLPRHAAALGLVGAFGTDPQPMTEAADRWNLPRFVHGRDWRTSAELIDLLDD